MNGAATPGPLHDSGDFPVEIHACPAAAGQAGPTGKLRVWRALYQVALAAAKKKSVPVPLLRPSYFQRFSFALILPYGKYYSIVGDYGPFHDLLSRANALPESFSLQLSCYRRTLPFGCRNCGSTRHRFTCRRVPALFVHKKRYSCRPMSAAGLRSHDHLLDLRRSLCLSKTGWPHPC